MLFNNQTIKGWDALWNLKIPPRIKIFLWQCGHKRLSTLALLKHCSINIGSSCQWCWLDEEDQEHLFFRCSLEKIGWLVLKRWLEVDLFIRDCRDFIEYFALARCKYSIEGGGICLASMLWSIWLARNEE